MLLLGYYVYAYLWTFVTLFPLSLNSYVFGYDGTTDYCTLSRKNICMLFHVTSIEHASK